MHLFHRRVLKRLKQLYPCIPPYLIRSFHMVNSAPGLSSTRVSMNTPDRCEHGSRCEHRSVNDLCDLLIPDPRYRCRVSPVHIFPAIGELINDRLPRCPHTPSATSHAAMFGITSFCKRMLAGRP